MEYNQFWELLAKVNAGEASPEEQLEFNQALLQSAEYQDLAREMNVFWNMPLPAAGEPGKEETSRKWQQLHRQLRPPAVGEGGRVVRKTGRVMRLYRLSAAAVILVAACWYAWWWRGQDLTAPGKNNIISTRYGSKTKVDLPDGTQVWLNGGSRIVYKGNYDVDDRQIELEGEAYFDVARDPGRPFLIHTRDMDIRVLGTAFNVQAYPNDPTSEAALIRGSIEVSFPGRPADRLILKPDEKITVVHTSGIVDSTDKAAPAAEPSRRTPRHVSLSLSSVTYQPADSSILETAWTTNKLVFRSKEFIDIARDMERWYNTTIRCTDSTFLGRRFTGTFTNESVTEALDALELSYPFHYRYDKQNNIVTITPQ